MKDEQQYYERDKDFGLPEAQLKPLARGRRQIRIAVATASIMLVISAGIIYWMHYLPHKESGCTHCIHKDQRDKSVIAKESESGCARCTHEDQSSESTTAGEAEGEKWDRDTHTSMTKEEAESLYAQASATPTRKKGTKQTLSTPQGCFHVVVGSYIDGDLASDHAASLAKQGADVTVITPAPGKYFYRVAIGQADSLHDAERKAAAWRATNGGNAWPTKY